MWRLFQQQNKKYSRYKPWKLEPHIEIMEKEVIIIEPKVGT
jgi:hypothetical protein